MVREHPQLFVTDEQIRVKQRKAREQLKKDPAFKALLKQTADAVHAERQYLFEQEPQLEILSKTIATQKKKP